jgi:hypothetical protein
MWCIVPDEQRSNGAKTARRFAVDQGSSLDCVGRLARGNQPDLRRPSCQRASLIDHDRFS